MEAPIARNNRIISNSINLKIMKIFHYLERIERIHKMVLQENTGNPDEFAKRLGISRTRLYEIMDELKLEGAPILYSKSCRTFYYEEPFHIEISFDIKSLDNEEITGGGQFFLQGPFFPDAGLLSLYCKLTTC
jgi:hypothetical protein